MKYNKVVYHAINGHGGLAHECNICNYNEEEECREEIFCVCGNERIEGMGYCEDCFCDF